MVDVGYITASEHARVWTAKRGVDADPVGHGQSGWGELAAGGHPGRPVLGDLPLRWSGRRVLVIGHVATRWGLDHVIGGVPLEELAAADFAWQEGWEYQLA